MPKWILKETCTGNLFTELQDHVFCGFRDLTLPIALGTIYERSRCGVAKRCERAKF